MEIDTNRVQQIARRWADTPYYEQVENRALDQWNNYIMPALVANNADFSAVIELSVGHGRVTNILLDYADRVTGVDVNIENIKFCQDRFKSHPKRERLTLIHNNGIDLNPIRSESATLSLCWDSMVHFEADVIRSYLREFYRVLKPNGIAFLHHSNFSKNPLADFQRNPHARNFMSKEMFAYYSSKEGFEIVSQSEVDWGSGEKRFEKLDCFTTLLRN